jgi:N-methylhydantoinase A/oxoprolinase/acetone carboxylase beta subunit
VRASIGAVEVGSPTVDTTIPPTTRLAYFPGRGRVETAVRNLAQVAPGEQLTGPAIIESPVTTIVLDTEATALRTGTGSLLIEPGGLEGSHLPVQEIAANG